MSGPGEVTVDGVLCFFKKWYYGGGGSGASLKELRAYKHIQEASAAGDIRADLRICRLHGVVINSDVDAEPGPPTSRLVGILLSYIETNKPRYVETLAYRVRVGNCTTEELERWTRELDSCIKELHRSGVVWGDAKPENVLVDGHDDVWVVGFGGSYTEGWVDTDKAGTVEGDLQGLERIKIFLRKAVNESGTMNGADGREMAYNTLSCL